MLVEAAQVTGARDYGGLAEAVFGPWGSFAVDLSLLLLCYGCLCSYLVAIGGLASALLQAWTSVDSALTSEVFLTLMAATLLLPICLARHYGRALILNLR
jgi:amino acid permease